MDSVNTSAAKDDDPGTQQVHDQNPAQPAGSSVASSDDGGQELPKEAEKLSPEAMEKALKKARSDAARYRTERNALRENADKWKEYENSQKSDLQRTQEQLAEVQEKLAQAEAEKTLFEVVSAYGIKTDDIALLGTGTKEELEVRAARIKELYGTQAQTSPPPSQTPRQISSGSGVEDKNNAGLSMYPESWIPPALREKKK